MSGEFINLILKNVTVYVAKYKFTMNSMIIAKEKKIVQFP